MTWKAYLWLPLFAVNILFICYNDVLPKICTTTLLSTDNCFLSCDDCEDLRSHHKIAPNEHEDEQNSIQQHGRHVSRLKYKTKIFEVGKASIHYCLNAVILIDLKARSFKRPEAYTKPYYYIFLFRYSLF